MMDECVVSNSSSDLRWILSVLLELLSTQTQVDCFKLIQLLEMDIARLIRASQHTNTG